MNDTEGGPILRPRLQFLTRSPAFRAAMSAPIDDAPVTGGDADAIARAYRDIESGNLATHEDVLSEFGVR